MHQGCCPISIWEVTSVGPEPVVVELGWGEYVDADHDVAEEEYDHWFGHCVDLDLGDVEVVEEFAELVLVL